MRAVRGGAASFQSDDRGDRTRGAKGNGEPIVARQSLASISCASDSSHPVVLQSLLPFRRVVVLYLYAHRVSYGKA
jgi:hypothetical protein